MFIPKDLSPLTCHVTLAKAGLSKVFGASFFLILLSTVGLSQVRFLQNGSGTLRGPDSGMFPDTPTRAKIDLAGTWQYTLDGISWNSVGVPSAYDQPARVIFQRTFEITSEMLDRYTYSLVVYGINYQAEITVNGIFIGRHIGGYTSFVIPFSDNILQVGSENVIRIAVDNELDARTTLPLRQMVGGWRAYGGIYRDIYLLATPKMFIAETEVQSDLSADFRMARLRVRSALENPGYGVKESRKQQGHSLAYVVEVYDKLTGALAGRSGLFPITVARQKTVKVSAELTIPAPKLWSPASPNLYVLKCLLVRVGGEKTVRIDEYDLNWGFRELKFKESNILLNGNPLTLKGVAWKEDHPHYGSAMTYEALEKDIVQIKSLGGNLVRFLHPPHPYMVNLCDRYGLFVLEELPLVGVPSDIMMKPQYQELVADYLKKMVMRDRYHPSILAWGLGDESDSVLPGSHACEFVALMRQLVSSADGRPTYFITRKVDDRCLASSSLLAISSYTKDAKDFRRLLKYWKEIHPSKPLIVTRYGKDIEPGNHSGYSDPMSLESQARYALQHFEAFRELDIVGSVWWTFNDWRGDRPALSTHSGNPYEHASGLVSYDREKRLAYDVVRSLYNGEKVAALPIGAYAAAPPMVFVVVGLAVLLGFAFFYSRNRRFSENVNRSLTRTYNFFADVRDQRVLSSVHSAFLAAVIAVTWATVLSSIFTHYRDNLFFDNLLSQFMPDFLKNWIVRLVWNPPKFILVFSGLLFVNLGILSALVRLCALIIRSHINFYHSVSVVVWSTLPYIILIPVAIILYRIMETSFSIVSAFALLGILTLWVIYRLLKGVSIIYDVYPPKVYAAGVLILVAGFALLYGYLDYTQATSGYLKHLMWVGGAVSVAASRSV